MNTRFPFRRSHFFMVLVCCCGLSAIAPAGYALPKARVRASSVVALERVRLPRRRVLVALAATAGAAALWRTIPRGKSHPSDVYTDPRSHASYDENFASLEAHGWPTRHGDWVKAVASAVYHNDIRDPQKPERPAIYRLAPGADVDEGTRRLEIAIDRYPLGAVSPADVEKLIVDDLRRHPPEPEKPIALRTHWPVQIALLGALARLAPQQRVDETIHRLAWEFEDYRAKLRGLLALDQIAATTAGAATRSRVILRQMRDVSALPATVRQQPFYPEQSQRLSEFVENNRSFAWGVHSLFTPPAW